MSKLVGTVIAASLGLGVVGVEFAQADRGFHNAASCLSSNEASPAKIWRGTFGFSYGESTSASVICPIRIDASGNIDPSGARVRVVEWSISGDVRCTPYFVKDGIATTFGTKYSCSTTSGGCASYAYNDYMDGYLEWPDADFPSGNQSGEMAAGFHCSVGPGDYVLNTVQVKSYEITY